MESTVLVGYVKKNSSGRAYLIIARKGHITGIVRLKGEIPYPGGKMIRVEGFFEKNVFHLRRVNAISFPKRFDESETLVGNRFRENGSTVERF